MSEEKEKQETTNTGTPFDDVFRTMVNDCQKLLLPVLNEMFHYSYEGSEQIDFLPTKRFLHNIDDKSEKRDSDSAFRVIDKNGNKRDFIIECQTNPDSSMAVRILEYGIKFAIDNAEKSKEKVNIKIPNIGVFQLRSTRNTPDILQIEITAPQNNKLTYDSPILKMKNYSLEDIFKKNLSFMLPFYMFNNESKLKGMDKKDFSKDILDDCDKIKKYLNNLESTFVRKSIEKMFLQVMTALSNNDPAKTLCKEAEKIMSGQILQYEAKDILNEGIALGKAEGISQGIKQKDEQIESKMFNYIENQKFYAAYTIKNLSSDVPEQDYDSSFMKDVIKVYGTQTEPLKNAVEAITDYKGETPDFTAKLLQATLKTEEYKQAFEKEQGQGKSPENTK